MSPWRLGRAVALGAVAVVTAVAAGCGAARSHTTTSADAADPGVTATVAATAVPSATQGRARRIILIIGDGMGFNQVVAGSDYRYGKPGRAAFESFPVTAAVSTYSLGGSYDPAAAWRSFAWVEHDPTDSAAAATAMATGQKTYDAAIGVDRAGRPIQDVVEVAEREGRSTGLVTSVPISHATPAGFAAHERNRTSYSAIARDLLKGSALDVLMGAGHPLYDNGGHRARADYRYVGGSMTWSDLKGGRLRNDADGDGDSDRWVLVESKTRFGEIARGVNVPRRVAGIARVRETLQQRRPGSTSTPFSSAPNRGVPTLATMALGALNVLERDPDGFFLMIEGGAGDWASHKRQKGRLIEEQLSLDDTVKAVATWVDAHGGWSDTLVVVTADHETGYLTGPDSGQFARGPVWRPIVSRGLRHVPAMAFHTDVHTNSLVPLYARGSGAERFGGVADQIDPRRGRYLDNTEIHTVLLDVMQ
jgi:alkaline phosphatase